MFEEKVLKWLYSLELPTGGIRAWEGEPDGERPYKEVTGYLIPTFFDYGARDIAIRCADWLVSVQEKDGSFDGYHKMTATFDTAACMEGLKRAFKETDDDKYYCAYKAAHDYIAMLCYNGENESYIYVSPHKKTHTYMGRVSGLMERKQDIPYYTPGISRWNPHWGHFQRTHYIGYCLDGLLSLGDESVKPCVERAYKFMTSWFVPMWVSEQWSSFGAQPGDVCATAQFIILATKLGLDVPIPALSLVRAMVSENGIRHDTSTLKRASWTAKFFLDMEKIIRE